MRALAILVAGILGACSAAAPGHILDPHNQDPMADWTDCHDGTKCPPEYPQCPLPGSGRHCEAAGVDFDVPAQSKRPARDGGS